MAEKGNTAEMRAALKEARKVIEAMGGYWARETLPNIDAALSAPARNCDKYGIDDVKEMDADFNAFCRQFGAKDGENCVGCPIKPGDNLCCHAAWMLLPAEGGGHANAEA